MAQELPGLKIPVTLDSDTFVREMRKISDGIDKLGRNVQRQNVTMSGAFNSITRSVKAFGLGLASAIGVGSISQFARLTKGALDAAGSIGELAQTAGTTTKQLQVLAFAGVQVGLSQDQIVNALGRFATAQGKAAAGGKEQLKVFQQYGISLRAGEQALGDVAEAVQNANSATERQVIVTALFGREGRKLIPLLAEGREGLEKFTQKAIDLNQVLGDDFIKQADTASDSLATFQTVIAKGFQVGFVQEFAGEIKITDTNLKSATEAAASFGRTVAQVMKSAIDNIRPVINFLETMQNIFDTLNSIAPSGNILDPVGIQGALLGAFKPSGGAGGDPIGQIEDISQRITHLSGQLVALNAEKEKFTKLAIENFVDPADSIVLQETIGKITTLSEQRDKLIAQLKELRGGQSDANEELDAHNVILDETANKITTLTTDLQNQAQAQIELRNALSGGGDVEAGALQIDVASFQTQADMVEEVNRQLEVRNQLLSSGVSLEEIHAAGLGELANNVSLVAAENANLQSVLDTGVKLEEEVAQLQLVVDARGKESAELEAQIELLKAKQEFGANEAAALEPLIVQREKLREQAEQLRDVDQDRVRALEAMQSETESIQEQVEAAQLLARYGGEETEEYRVQVALLKLKQEHGAEYAASMEDEVRQLEAINTQLGEQDEAGKQLEATYENFLSSMQSATADVFQNIFEGGVTSFKDLFKTVKQLAIKWAAEVAALMVFNPQLAFGAAGGGTSPTPASVQSAAQVTAQLQKQTAATQAAVQVGTQQGIIQASARNAYYPPAGAGALPGPGQPRMGPGGMMPPAGRPEGGPGGMMPPRGAGAAGAAAPTDWGGIGMSALGGAAGGFAISGMIAPQSTGIGGAVGGGIGAAAGYAALAPYGMGPLGGAIGGIMGGAAGSVIEGLFGGGGGQKGKGTIQGGLGQVGFGGRGLTELAGAVGEFDAQISQMLTERQRKLVDQALRRASGIPVNFKGELTADVTQNVTRERGKDIARALGFSSRGVAPQDASGQQIVQNLQSALQTRRAIQDLTGRMSEFDRQVEDMGIEFEDLNRKAKQFGVRVDGLAEAFSRQKEDLQKAQDAQIAALLDPFEALSTPLKAFQRELEFAGLGPLQQFAKAQAEFARLTEEAQAGSFTAIQQLEGAGRAFIDLAGQIGSSPAQADAVRDVSAALADVQGAIADAEREAGEGIEDVLVRNNRAEIDTLRELIDEVREVSKELRRQR